MQNSTSKDKERVATVTISPNLLKNFNVYDILEPVKNDVTSDAAKVDKLIDVDDSSRDSGFQDADINASFLDNKKEFNLVDLFQNIFVTPQHIKKKETNDDLGAMFSEEKVVDPGYNKFFDMLESGQKIDWTNISTKEKSVLKHNFVQEKPKVLVPKVNLSESESDPEELIHEVLTNKIKEKVLLGSVSDSYDLQTKIDRKIPKIDVKMPKIIKTPDLIPEFSHRSENCSCKGAKLENVNNENVPQPSGVDTRRRSERLLQKNLERQNKVYTTDFVVKAMQKDEKTYRKKRLQKPEHLKANYTKGPDFYEKTVVLPQIMARLNAKLAELDEKSNQKRKLILDVGTVPNSDYSPKKEVKDIKTKLNYLPETAKYQPEAAKKTLNLEMNNKKPHNQGLQSIKTVKVNQKEAQMCVNKTNNNIAVHSTVGQCLNCSKPNKNDNSIDKKSSVNNFGELNPVVLMEDCKKERLRALKQSKMFKDFILNGKYGG
uniref:SFRICE_008890 n=1 Tax=Spodoptera frugiperda TaxID=7108 RepID=A0A2H1VMV2_SPOFR